MTTLDMRHTVFALDADSEGSGAIEAGSRDGVIVRFCFADLYELRDLCYRLREVCLEAEANLKRGGIDFFD